MNVNVRDNILKVVSSLYVDYNYLYFKNKLMGVTITLIDSDTKFGHWNHSKREIALNINLFTKYSNWYEAKLTLKHEMAHQYVDEVLGASGSVDPHGAMFNQIAQEEEFEFLLEKERLESRSGDPIVAKIEKLLSLGQSDNPSEAENAVKFANKLMKKWNVTLVNDDKERNYITKIITEPQKRKSYHSTLMSSLLRKFFFVQTIWSEDIMIVGTGVKSGYVLEITGSKENVDLASYTKDFIMKVAEREFKRIKKEKPYIRRNNFLTGVVSGFWKKLEDEELKYEDGIRQEESSDLVYMGDPKLDEYFKKKYPKVKTIKRSNTGTFGHGFSDGEDVGKKLNVHKGINKGTSEKKLYLN
jgi:hypothetical protein